MEIYLGIGSNLGDRHANLRAALTALGECGFTLDACSPVVETPALLPDDAEPDWNRPFLNAVVRCSTTLTPSDALAAVKGIEQRLGRDPSRRWSPRPIDIDLLLWGSERFESTVLTIPHPGLTQRNFVLAPLAALAPRLVVPGTGRTVLEHSRALTHRLPLWMGIINITPDSFSDGGAHATWETIEPHVDGMLAAGAQWLDLGAESTRPGAAPLDGEAEWARLAPVLERLRDKLGDDPLRARISVDTYHAEVARRALAAGADLINDVSGLRDPAMRALAAESGAEFVAMHSLTVPADRAVTLPQGTDPVEALKRWLDAQMREWASAGIDPAKIVFDPGIGFGKNPLQSLELLRRAAAFHEFGLRCLIGHSRKSFMAGFAGQDVAVRDLFTIGASLNLCAQGVDVLRVHNIEAHIAAYRGWAHLLEP